MTHKTWTAQQAEEIDRLKQENDQLKRALAEANKVVFVTKEGLECALRLKNIQIAELKLALAHEKYNHAGLQIAVGEVAVKAAKEASQCRSS